MSMISIWKEDSLQTSVREIRSNTYNDRFFIEVNPEPSAYIFNEKLIFFPKTYYMNLKKEEISNNNTKLLNSKKSLFLKHFLRKRNIANMRVLLKDSVSYSTIESIPESIIKETIALSQKTQKYYFMLIKLKFKKDNYHKKIATHYLDFVKKYGFRTANSKLSMFSILNRFVKNERFHKLSLSEVFKEKINSYKPFTLKEDFYDDYYLAEKDFHNLDFPHYNYSESLLRLVFLDKDDNYNKNTRSFFSLESFLSDDKNLYCTPLSVFSNLKRNNKDHSYTEIVPQISEHFKQHTVFFSSNDFLSLCTVYGRVQLNKDSSYDSDSLIHKEIKSIEKLMIELSQWKNLMNNHYFISQFINNSFFYKKFSYQYNISKSYYNDYITPRVIFKITLLSTLTKIMNKNLSLNVDRDIIQSIHYDNRLFDDLTIDNIESISKKYVEVGGKVDFNFIRNIVV